MFHSLVPYQLHPIIAEKCVQNQVDMITTSYVTPQLASLHDSAVEAGVCLMNECGLDPGIDHMLAMQCIDETHKANGKVSGSDSLLSSLPTSLSPLNPKWK